MSLDEGFDSRSIDDANKYFEARNRSAKDAEIERLRQHNIELLELVANLKKDGYTYDQLTRKIIVCEACGKMLKDNK